MDETAQVEASDIERCCIQGWTDDLGGLGNYSLDPLFRDADAGNFRLVGGSPCINSGTGGGFPFQQSIDLDGAPRFMGTHCGESTQVSDLGAFEFYAEPGVPQPILYVRASATGLNNGSSWTDAFVDLDDALCLSDENPIVDEIWVAAGDYWPHAAYSSTGYELEHVGQLYGGFAGTETRRDQRDPSRNITRLRGDRPVGDGTFVHAKNVIIVYWMPDTAIIDGFTIRGGNATIGGSLSGNRGGGIYAFGGVEAHNCIFEENKAENVGGAVYDVFSLVDCKFVENEAYAGGAAWFEHSAVAKIVRCSFVGNTAETEGGAIGGEADQLFEVNSCLIIGNEAQEGGGLSIRGEANVVNTLISQNVAARGGAVMTDSFGGDPAHIINCTIVDNIASELCGGVLHDDSSARPIVVNSILWGNIDPTGAGFAAQVAGLPGLPFLHYCNIQGLDGEAVGAGNFSSDPLFVDAAKGDFRLASRSPCIDAGINTVMVDDKFDLDADRLTSEFTPLDLGEEARFAVGAVTGIGCGVPVIVDMGAFEFVGSGPQPKRGDLNGDLTVDGLDLAILLGMWGSYTEGCRLGDLDFDFDYSFEYDVDGYDLAILIGQWGQ
jgi:hypothetical protein